MEPETNEEEVVVEMGKASRLHTITPLSKYLAMILFVILPFLGGWVGYHYAPERVIIIEGQKKALIPTKQPEVSVYDDDHIVGSSSRPLFSRIELLSNERALSEEYGLYDERFGTAGLYHQRDTDIETMYVEVQKNGLSLVLPYNNGYGAPYYQLTKYDDTEQGIIYGDINPCPSGCFGSGGLLRGEIRFYEPNMSASLRKNHLSEFADQHGYCKDVNVNKNLSGIYCYANYAHFSHPKLIIEGKDYTYEIVDQKCRLYEEDEIDECKTIAESIAIEY